MKKLLLLPLIFLGACTKVIEYEIPRVPDRISIDARIVEGDTVNVICGKSSFVMDAAPPSTDTLYKVYLYENGNMIEELKPRLWGIYSVNWFFGFDNIFYIYTSTYFPQAGNTYRIEAHRNGLPSASGEQKLMSPVQIIDWSFNDTTGNLSVSFNDDPKQGSYYSIRIVERYFNGFKTAERLIPFSTNQGFIDFFYNTSEGPLEEGEGTNRGLLAYFTDEYFKNKLAKVDLMVEMNAHFGNSQLILEVNSLSKDLYLHERSKAGQYQTENLFGEPVQIYSNVENGYGIVGATAPNRIILN